LAISSGRDLLIRAKTGSGKTLGYLLPTLHKILSKKSSSGGIEAVIMVPTRELCHQVQKTIESLSYYCDDAITVAVLSIGKVRGSKSRQDLERQEASNNKSNHHQSQSRSVENASALRSPSQSPVTRVNKRFAKFRIPNSTGETLRVLCLTKNFALGQRSCPSAQKNGHRSVSLGKYSTGNLIRAKREALSHLHDFYFSVYSHPP
jgi:Rad3-related DNA helicase